MIPIELVEQRMLRNLTQYETDLLLILFSRIAPGDRIKVVAEEIRDISRFGKINIWDGMQGLSKKGFIRLHHWTHEAYDLTLNWPPNPEDNRPHSSGESPKSYRI